VTTPAVALVAADASTRKVLADYLAASGFDVRACALADADACAAIVLVGDDAAAVRGWLDAATVRRVVVVTTRPQALKDLAAEHAERLVVLPAPAFGWDLVDALRVPSVVD